MNKGPRVRTGLDEILKLPARLRGLRFALVANPASVSGDFLHASVALQSTRGLKLTALFGPEHGIWANAQDLVEVDDSRDPRTGLPVHSLYGRTRVPTSSALAGIDAVVVDLQDVGARYYTYVYTMLYVLEACAKTSGYARRSRGCARWNRGKSRSSWRGIGLALVHHGAGFTGSGASLKGADTVVSLPDFSAIVPAFHSPALIE